MIGTLKRECTDHLIALSEMHLRRKLAKYVRYYNEHRLHESLDGDSPLGRQEEPPDQARLPQFHFSAACIIGTPATQPEHADVLLLA